MPQQPGDNRPATKMSPEDYRRLQAARAEKRKKRRKQQIVVLAVFALAIILLVVCIVLVVRSLFKKSEGGNGTSGITSSVTGDAGGIITWPTAEDKNAWNLWLINAQNTVTADFERPEMVQLTEVGYWFDARIVSPLTQMLNDCNAVEGHDLRIVSGFRSYEKQEENFEYYVNLYRGQGAEDPYAEAAKHEAYPGATDHHTGLAVDFAVGSAEVSDSFVETSEYAWLMENAANYGFVLRYPGEKQSITGVPFVAYHFRYVGVDDAHVMNSAGICLEEYLTVLPTSPQPEDGAGEGGEGQPEGEPTGGVAE